MTRPARSQAACGDAGAPARSWVPLVAGALSGALIAAIVVASACSSARRSDVTHPPQQLTDEERRGEIAFARHCHSCHPGGQGGLGPALNNKPLPGFAIKLQVRHGAGSMPAFPEHRLADADLDAIVAYLQALRSR